jgi:hypothetical protein
MTLQERAIDSYTVSAIFEEKAGAFAKKMNQDSFIYRHKLVGHPLFELSRLSKLAERIINSSGHAHVMCKVAESAANAKPQWQDFISTEKVADAIVHIRESGSWVMIGHAQEDPDYQALLNTIVEEIERMADVSIRDNITWIDAHIFIGSPNSVTHYHVDSETNFLFQIHGSKEAHLFDHKDRSVISEEEIESFLFSGKQPKFKEHYEKSATVFQMPAGTGIHIPVTAPHWVKNLDDYSVTFSTLLYLRNMDELARVHQVNHLLRSFGLRPSAPGKSPALDRLKINGLGMLSKKNPTTKWDVLHSGVDRLIAPVRVARKILRGPGNGPMKRM